MKPSEKVNKMIGYDMVKGTKEKKSSDDTWCDEHQAFFSKGENHKWSWASKSGSCNVAKSKLGKSK